MGQCGRSLWLFCVPSGIFGKSYEKDLKCLFFRTILSIEGICDESVMELGRNC